MRVLHMVPDIGISNGVMSVVMNYFRAMPKDVYFDVVYFQENPQNRKEQIESLGGRVFKVRAPSIKSLFASDVDALFQEHAGEWSAVHIHAPHFAVFLAPIAKKYGIKHIACHCHSTWYSLNKKNSFRNQLLAEPSYNLCGLHLACSKDAGRFWWGNKPFSVLNNAVDCKKLQFNKNVRAEVRHCLKMDQRFVVGHVGRTVPPQKNHPFLLKIFAEIKKKMPNAVLLLVGADADDDLVQLAEKLQIQEDVRFLGQRTDIPNLLCAMDVFIFPSFQEGLPVAVVEAQASGLPVLMSDTITDEVKITQNVFSMSLDSPASDWAEKALSMQVEDREEAAQALMQSGWDIHTSAAALYQYYASGKFVPLQTYPKRVLLVFGRMNRGGAETLAMNIYRNIDRSKLQFDFMVHTKEHCAYDDEIRTLGGKIYSVDQYNVLNHFRYVHQWKEFFKKHHEYRVIHAHMTGSAAVFLPIAKKAGCFAISHSHIVESKSGFRQKIVNLYRLPLRYISDYMFACSKEAGYWMFGHSIDSAPNYEVLNNGVDCNKFSFSAIDRTRLRQELGLEKQFVLCNIARFHPQKNHMFLLDVFRCVCQMYPNSHLILAGDGSQMEAIQRKVYTLGLSEKVHFLGVRSDIPAVLSAADVFVMPSFFEGLPLSLVEAQANGIHIVASDVISKEICLTDLIEFLPLDAGVSCWAKTILQYKDGYKRSNQYDSIAKAGYNIQTIAARMQNFYLKHCGADECGKE